MRITLTKYISREIWSIFLTCLMVIIFIMLSTKMLGKDDLVLNYGVGFGELLGLMIILLPKVILFAMPAACLMAVLLSFIRLSSDNEIIALHSSGISLYQLMPPVIIFAVICSFAAGFMTFYWVPYGNRTYKSTVNEIISSKTDLVLKEQVFGKLGDDFVYYMNSYSAKDKMMEDVFFVNKSDDQVQTFVAKKGRIIKNKGSNIVTLHLIDGLMITDRERSIFSTLTKSIKIDDMLSLQGEDEYEPDEMYLDELLGFISKSKENRNLNIARLTLYEMFSLPLSVFLISITGAPLGSHIRSQGRTKGIIISFLLFLSYYITLATSRYLCEAGTVLPSIGVWMPVFFLLLISVFLLKRSTNDLPYVNFSRLVDWFYNKAKINNPKINQQR